MPRRVPSPARPDPIEALLPGSRSRRRCGLGPVGSAMIELIGASLVTPAAQPQAAIWAKL